LQGYQKRTLLLPSGEEILVFIAKNETQQKRGLSTIKNADFTPYMGMLFPISKMRLRQFWMPETYFDLDIIFMNEDLYVLDIHRNMPHSSGSKKNAKYSKKVFSQHVLEIKSSSPLAKKIVPGMIFKWKKKAGIL
jgi:uncharacterized membrane protein (UPF0127 family)